MNIIGIHGLIGSGKDTLCSILKGKLSLKGYTSTRLGFADSLKREIAYMLLNYEFEGFDALDSVEVEDAVNAKVDWINENKNSFRLILQGWGTDFRRKLCDQDYWVKKWERDMLRKKDKFSFIVAPDVRFANEMEVIKKHNGLLVRMDRQVCVQSFHTSEQALFNGMKFDFEVDNNHEIRDLEIQADILLYKMGYR